MNIAVILAGGVGRRMGSETPKQFLEILGKPVIIYTLEKYQENPIIDAIQVVSVKEYIDKVWEYAKKYNITKLKWVSEGGNTAQESTRNGVFSLEDICNGEDILIFHMSVSPLIDEEIIEDSIRVCQQHGVAIAASQSIFNLCETNDGLESDKYYSKSNLVTLNMPWTIKYKKALDIYRKSIEYDIGNKPDDYLVSLLIDLGEKLYFSKDSQKNKLKLTTFDDVDLLKGYIMLKNKENKK